MSKDTGGPAFPFPMLPEPERWDGDYQAGMTLRDYFAAKAMQALIACKHDQHMRQFEGWRDEFAREAGRYADAMLAERQK